MSCLDLARFHVSIHRIRYFIREQPLSISWIRCIHSNNEKLSPTFAARDKSCAYLDMWLVSFHSLSNGISSVRTDSQTNPWTPALKLINTYEMQMTKRLPRWNDSVSQHKHKGTQACTATHEKHVKKEKKLHRLWFGIVLHISEQLYKCPMY